jgi:phospholipid/cholesterol/gamma-HCH transport system permease protein
MGSRIVEALSRFGEQVIGCGRAWVDVAALLYDTLVAAFTPGRGGYRALFRQMISQILFTGFEALWLVSVVALVTGATVVLQATANMPRFGASEYFGRVLIAAIVRELGPFFTALIVISRSGTAFATFVGNMRAGREISALEVMGIDPIHFLILPAFGGMVAGMICLSVYFDIIALGGGLLVAAGTANLPLVPFARKLIVALTFPDLFISLAKAALFGVIAATVSSYHGLTVRGIRGVPQAALKSVVNGMAGMLVVSVIMTVVWFYWNG